MRWAYSFEFLFKLFVSDVDDTLVNLDENSSTTFEPSVSVEEAPLSQQEPAEAPDVVLEPADAPDVVPEPADAPRTERRSLFEVQIGQAISQCRRRARQPTCSWRSGRIITSQGRIVEREVSDDFCCCACHRVDECQAVHYERLEGKCVFHEGPTSGDQRQSGAQRWVKE